MREKETPHVLHEVTFFSCSSFKTGYWASVIGISSGLTSELLLLILDEEDTIGDALFKGLTILLLLTGVFLFTVLGALVCPVAVKDVSITSLEAEC